MAPTPVERPVEEVLAEIDQAFETLLMALETNKPNDRTRQDRRWAIVITETEKAQALYRAWFVDSRGVPK